MKRFFAFLLLVGFAFAVCHASPESTGFYASKTEFAKKSFEMPAAEMPAEFQLPIAPVLVHSLDVQEISSNCKIVIPQSNSPPQKDTPITYSMAFWRIYDL